LILFDLIFDRYAAYVDQCCLLRMQENVCTGERHEMMVKSLQDLQDQDVLVYKPCEELRCMLENGCITPVLSGKPGRIGSSSSSTSSPSLKRKGRCPSISSMTEKVNRFAPLLANIDVSACEKALINDLLGTGDELVVDALEQFSISRNYAGLRRVLHGPVKKELTYSPPRVESLDHLSANFASLDVETPIAIATPQQEQQYPFLVRMGESCNQIEEKNGCVEDPIPLSLDGPLMMKDPMLKTRSSVVIPSPPTFSPGGVHRPSLLLENNTTLGEREEGKRGGEGEGERVDQGVFMTPPPSSGGIFHLPSIQERMFSPPSQMELNNDFTRCCSSSGTWNTNNINDTMMMASLLENVPVKIDEDFYQKYSMGKILGSGKCSIVKEAIEKKNPKNKFAVKIIQKRQVLTTLEMVRFLKREIEILSSLKHEGIVQLIGIYETFDELFLVMELCQQELFQQIDENGPLEEKIAKKLIHKLVQTVKYLHTNSIVHRDIKPENILIVQKKDVANIKLADFGIARRLEGRNHQVLLPTKTTSSSTSTCSSLDEGGGGGNRTARAHTRCGTRDYIAPEVMSTKGYGTEADMWSIGVVTFVLISGSAPVFLPSTKDGSGEGGATVYFGGGPNDVWSTVSEELKDFISKLLVRNPEERMTASKALEHPWLYK
jgi:tRNA A-37 threonylcarbamoyl transferase component Bud32